MFSDLGVVKAAISTSEYGSYRFFPRRISRRITGFLGSWFARHATTPKEASLSQFRRR
jgi:hypothetical protein